jgi:hypothetical protein
VSARRERQADQLRRLCRAGAASRAIDLAFEHFAEFGRDETIVALLGDAVAREELPQRVRVRFGELCAIVR